MRTWLRLTCLFGAPDNYAAGGDIVCESIGAILRADADDLVLAPMPLQFAKLLHQIAQTERELAAESRFGATVSDTVRGSSNNALAADGADALLSLAAAG